MGNGWGGRRLGAGRKPAGATALPPIAALTARVAVLERTCHDLAAIVARGRGLRDNADAALIAAIHAATAGDAFMSRELCDHARVVPALGLALEAADLTTAQELGHWLRRVEGQRSGSLIVVCVEPDRDGHSWAVRDVRE